MNETSHPNPRVFRTKSELEEWVSRVRHEGKSIGFVPTMGALHEGHMSLVKRSVNENDFTVVSIFVNPSQFNNSEDLIRYPRTESADIDLLRREGVHTVFAPQVGEIYPEGFSTWIDVEGITQSLEGEHRPGHFRGVATVVTLLFRMVKPNKAYFGEKDWQQLQLIRTVVRDLILGVDIIGVPIMRENNGLAMSSRNVRLSESARRSALNISAAIKSVELLFSKGERSPSKLNEELISILESEPDLKVEYAVIADAETLEPVENFNRPARILIAAWSGGVRLIDNGPLPSS